MSGGWVQDTSPLLPLLGKYTLLMTGMGLGWEGMAGMDVSILPLAALFC